MLRIAKLTDYALLILSHLAKDSMAILSASSLADALHLTPPTVSKILKMLADAKLVTSMRGVDGGYRLAQAPENISLADVISAMEGDFALTECAQKTSFCSVDSVCALKKNWQKINVHIHKLLKNITIVDMQQPLSGELFWGENHVQ